MIKLHLASRMVLMGSSSHAPEVRPLAQSVLYNLRQRRGYNPDASRIQQAAVHASGSRYEALAQLRTPTLVIHDRADPFIPIVGPCVFRLPMAAAQYIQVVDYTGRQIRPDKRGAIAASQPPALRRLGPILRIRRDR